MSPSSEALAICRAHTDRLRKQLLTLVYRNRDDQLLVCRFCGLWNPEEQHDRNCIVPILAPDAVLSMGDKPLWVDPSRANDAIRVIAHSTLGDGPEPPVGTDAWRAWTLVWIARNTMNWYHVPPTSGGKVEKVVG